MASNPITIEETAALLKEMQFSYETEYTDADATITLLAPNGKIHVVLMFKKELGEYILFDIVFGAFSFMLSRLEHAHRRQELSAILKEITEDSMRIILGTNAKNEKWRCTLYFNLANESDRRSYERKIKRIEGNKNLLDTILRKETKYEIYGWKQYRTVIRS